MITQERAKNLEAQIQAQAKRLEKQSAALKLAKTAFLSVCGCYPLHYSTKPGFREANEALAAMQEDKP